MRSRDSPTSRETMDAAALSPCIECLGTREAYNCGAGEGRELEVLSYGVALLSVESSQVENRDAFCTGLAYVNAEAMGFVSPGGEVILSSFMAAFEQSDGRNLLSSHVALAYKHARQEMFAFERGSDFIVVTVRPGYPKQATCAVALQAIPRCLLQPLSAPCVYSACSSVASSAPCSPKASDSARHTRALWAADQLPTFTCSLNGIIREESQQMRWLFGGVKRTPLLEFLESGRTETVLAWSELRAGVGEEKDVQVVVRRCPLPLFECATHAQVNRSRDAAAAVLKGPIQATLRMISKCRPDRTCVGWYCAITDLVPVPVAAASGTPKDGSHLAFICHELRQPFSVAQLALKEIQHILRENSAEVSKELIFETISDCEVALEHANVIMQDTLFLEKAAQVGITLEPTLFAIGQLADDLYNTFKYPFRSKELQLTVQTFPHHGRTVVYADRHRMMQVASNFLSNASKFTPRNGSVLLSIAVMRDCVGSPLLLYSEGGFPAKMRLSCRDTGVGISQPDIQKLFQPFQQIKARELQNGGGTGLGLSICKHVMEAQGGFAGCHSEDAKGSEFFFEVLVYEYTDALAMDALHEWSTSKLQRSCSDQEVYCESPRTRTLSQSFSQSCTPDESVELESTTVLLVDDDRMVQKLIKRALQRMNVSVVQAYTGDEAVAAAEAHRSAIRLVLMDNHMPSMQGPEATRKLKISCPEMYVVGLTGSSEDSDIQEFLTAGAQEVLVKPIDMNRLQQIVGMHA